MRRGKWRLAGILLVSVAAVAGLGIAALADDGAGSGGVLRTHHHLRLGE